MFTGLTSLLKFFLIGLLAGWFSSIIMKRPRGGFWRYLIIGVIGALVGGFVFRLIDLAVYGLIGELVMATVGAVLLLFLLRRI